MEFHIAIQVLTRARKSMTPQIQPKDVFMNFHIQRCAKDDRRARKPLCERSLA